MNQVIHDVYELNLATTGKLKLRAKGLLANGTPEDLFDACVLLHDAARIHHQAVSALPACPPETRLSSAAEECWCYVEGRDPPRAAEAWGQVLRARQDVAGPTAEAILSRVAPRFESSRREFARAVTSSPMLLATRNAGSLAVLALLAGRKPTMDILYLAGLSHLAVASSPTADVAEVLTASAREAA